MVIDAPLVGAVALITNAALPVAELPASPDERATEHVRVWPDEPHDTDVTPAPATAELNVIPEGRTSCTVAEVPDVPPPLLPIPIV